MRKIVSREDLQLKMQEAISILCDTVKSTLGPKGSNVIIDHSSFSPFITNDGVTIAENIQSEDVVINTILELAKEASFKTNESVGDGTTTTLVLLESIFMNGLKLIQEGKNPLILKKELDCSLKKIIAFIENSAHKPSKEELKYIASISSNDEEMGAIVSESFLKVLNKDAILIKEGNENKDKFLSLNGYTFETILASPYFLSGRSHLNYKNPSFLIINKYIDNLEELADILNYVIKDKISLVIIASDYSEEVVQNILTINNDYEAKIVLLKTPAYGIESLYTLEDIAAITNAKLINNDSLTLNDLGYSENIKIDHENTLISFKKSARVIKRIEDLEKEAENNLDSNLAKRIAMLKKGLITILVSSFTKVERREKIMRYTDALEAISASYKGVLPGSGLIFSKCSNELLIESDGDKIFKEALLKPLEQILINSANDYNVIYKKIKNNNFQILYNVVTDKYENINTTKVLDPKEVVINSLISATSIAGMLLSTTSLVINEEVNLNKENKFLEDEV